MTERNPLPDCLSHMRQWEDAIRQRALDGVKRRLDLRLNNKLVDMKPDYDDSIVGFNEAWDIVRETFEAARR